MAAGLAQALPGRLEKGLAVGTHLDAVLPAAVRWIQAGHPVPDRASEEAGRAALELAHSIAEDGLLLVLISGGGSALLSAPADGLTLESKREVTKRLLAGGADICEMNTVRKHLSAVKGGRLAAASRGTTVALAISDVVGDDLSIIASGPTVADASRFDDALAVLSKFGGRASYPPDAIAVLEAGARGEIPETPKPGDVRLRRSHAWVIGSRASVLNAVAASAASAGYFVHVMDEPVTGESRAASPAHVARMLKCAEAGGRRPACVVSGGETTVRVCGDGLGGRNQEFALAALPVLATARWNAVLASIGTDGVDGPTDAAGAVADTTTAFRAAVSGLHPVSFLDRNDAYHFFEALGDLVITGPTGTNVGDMQILLAVRT